MKWIAEPVDLKPRHFVIEHDPSAGFYLYVFEGGRDTHDYLQDTLEAAMEMAEEDFRVPRSEWRKV